MEYQNNYQIKKETTSNPPAPRPEWAGGEKVPFQIKYIGRFVTI